jgi:superfamily II RNA helicase
LITARGHDGVTAIREDGRYASFPLQRIGRVFAPTFSGRSDRLAEAFDEIHDRADELALAEPRLRDAQSGEEDSLKLISDLTDLLSTNVDRELLWSLQNEAAALRQADSQIESLRAEIWEPFERCALVLERFGYLDFTAERVTERGKWLADLRVDRPLLIGEALQRELFATVEAKQLSALVAALVADEDRDYGEQELDDAVVNLLIKFEEVSFEVSTEEWKQGIEAVSEINFSAAAAAALWADGATWSELVHDTRAEEGDLVRLLSRTGEALLQIAGLRQNHPKAANLASQAAEIVLREPVR